ncbi:hypothetical protein N8766_03925 [bacterium]|nr:hypothetical protein [bacterium]
MMKAPDPLTCLRNKNGIETLPVGDDLETQETLEELSNDTLLSEAIQTIRDAFVTDRKAAAWYLERRYPFEFGRKIPTQSNETTFAVRNDLGPKPRFAMDLTDDPGAKN